MRKIVSWVLLGLGSFLLVAAIVAVTWAGDRVERTPLNTDSTTHLEGTATVLPAGPGDYAIRATSFTRADSDASDDTVIVWENHSCLVLDVPDTPTAATRVSATTRDPNVVVDQLRLLRHRPQHRHAVSTTLTTCPRRSRRARGPGEQVALPTPRRRTTTTGTAPSGSAVPATYEDTEEIDGLEVYRFEMSVATSRPRSPTASRAPTATTHDLGRAQDRRTSSTRSTSDVGRRRDAGARPRDGVHRRAGGRLRRRRRGQHLPASTWPRRTSRWSASSAVRS